MAGQRSGITKGQPRILGIVYRHQDPAHAWTVASLAQRVGMSRSTFAGRFTELVGEPPLHYVTRWRMQKAAGLLRDGRSTLADMKSWVDSAAGALAVRVDTGAALAQDSAARRTQVQSGGEVERTPPAASDTTRTFRDGAAAPDTATPLPGIALAGLALLGTGLWLRRRA